MAGYLYQARYALSVCLRYAYADAGVSVALERMDDVSFQRDGTPFEQLQTKHHIRRAADLSDASPDLWKTLRVWATQVGEDPGIPSRTRLVLVTTANAKLGTAAALLRATTPDAPIPDHNAKEAARLLTAVAEAGSSTTLKPAYDAFLSLTPPLRASLLSAVQIVDGQPTASELSRVIEHGIRMAVPRGKASLARETLEGWWWGRVLVALTANPPEAISVLEVENKLDDIRETLQRDGLVADMEHVQASAEEIQSYDDAGFVRQLRAVGVGPARVDMAKQDFYRAYAQRSSWSRQHAVLDGEVARFEGALIEEWRPRFQRMCDDHQDCADESLLRKVGQEVFNWVETEARFPFRNLVKRFLTVGSYHILADGNRVGWHRDYQALSSARPE